MTSKSERRAMQEKVSAYHEARLGELIDHVRVAVDGFRAGDLDALDVDQEIFQYSRAAKALWKFCTLGHVEWTASLIDEDDVTDWWEQGAFRRR